VKGLILLIAERLCAPKTRRLNGGMKGRGWAVSEWVNAILIYGIGGIIGYLLARVMRGNE
jgi:hypothetical protein